MKSSRHVILLLDNIRSAHNVGSLFRIADTIGVSEIILSGITPCPIDRFDRPVKEIVKTALGAEQTIPWRYTDRTIDELGDLKKQGFSIVMLEQASGAVDYKTRTLPEKAVFVVGNEVTGISAEVLALADVVIEIPLQGKKESLNVAVATAIALFRLLDN